MWVWGLLVLTSGLGGGLIVARPLGVLPQLLAALVLGALMLGLVEWRYGYWQELRPFWRRDGEYWIAMLVALAGAGYAIAPLCPLEGPGKYGLGVAAFACLQACELVVRWGIERKKARISP